MTKTHKPRTKRDPNDAPVWWGIPKRFSADIQQRKISWLELFYDLVYAGAIAQLTEHLAHHPDLSSVGYVAFLFAFLYWAWTNGSFYHDLHGTPGVRSRLTTLWQMLSMAAVAVTLPGVFDGQYTGFAVSFGILQGIITYLWWSTGYYDPGHIVLNRWYVRNHSIGFILLMISAFTPVIITHYIWIAVLILNYTPGLLTARTVQREIHLRHTTFRLSESMIERLGLFTMIVLGEGILGIIHGLGDCPEISPMGWLCFILSVFVVFLLWWIYYDLLGESEARPGFSYFHFISMGYFPLLFSFAVVGASMRIMLADTSGTPHLLARTMLGAAITVILFCTVLISRAMEQDKAEEQAVRKILWLVIVTSVLVAVITALGGYMSLWVFLLLIVIILLTSIAFAFRIWLGYGLFSQGT